MMEEKKQTKEKKPEPTYEEILPHQVPVQYNRYDGYSLYCPLCKSRFHGSDYLETVFEDEAQLWLANMVMHYRHNHITSWNKCWGRYGSRYRQNWFGNYDEEKAKVNERAKRQIIRKAKDYLNAIGVKVSDFEVLQNTTEETLEVARKYLQTE